MFNLFLKKIGILSAMVCGLTYAANAENSTPFNLLKPAALDAAGIRTLQQADPNLSGNGVVIAAVCRSMTYYNGTPQNDYRFNMRHQSLQNADVLFEDHSDGKHGISPHATAIAGILVGLDPQATLSDGQAFEYRGVSPYASVDVYEFWRFAALWLFARKPIPADIITLSLGDVFEDWWTRGIEQLAAENGTIIVAAIGNGQAAYDALLYPAAGANVIGVGVINSTVNESGRLVPNEFAVPTARHSSPGPTYDQRSKPDLVAPGSAIIPDAYTENNYTMLANASSLAAPMVAGTAALLLQKATEDESLLAAIADAPVNCVIKSVLMNSARKLPYWHKGAVSEDDDRYTPLDRLQGAGALDAAAAMSQLTAGRQAPGTVASLGWDSRAIRPDEVLYYVIETFVPAERLSATLTWNRHFENRYPFRPKPEQSNLRLELWAIETDTSHEMVMIDVSDSAVDTVEHLWTPLSDEYTRYLIAVRFSSDAASPATVFERFALAWSVGPDASAGHPYWEDLNGDGSIDMTDQLIKTLLIEGDGDLELLTEAFSDPALNLSPVRAELLTALWHRWKPYLTTEPQQPVE